MIRDSRCEFPRWNDDAQGADGGETEREEQEETAVEEEGRRRKSEGGGERRMMYGSLNRIFVRL